MNILIYLVDENWDKVHVCVCGLAGMVHLSHWRVVFGSRDLDVHSWLQFEHRYFVSNKIVLAMKSCSSWRFNWKNFENKKITFSLLNWCKNMDYNISSIAGIFVIRYRNLTNSPIAWVRSVIFNVHSSNDLYSFHLIGLQWTSVDKTKWDKPMHFFKSNINISFWFVFKMLPFSNDISIFDLMTTE